MKKGRSKYNSKKYTCGKTFGMWTVVSSMPFVDSRYNSYCIKAKCKCGKESVLPCLRLEKNTSKGCQSCRVAGKGSYLWKGVGDISGRLLSQIKYSAKKRNIKYKLSDDFLWNLYLKQNKKCALTGIDLILDSSNYNKNTASLDRINSSLGYIENNVIWVHKDINILKNKFEIDYLITLCEKIYDNRENIRNRNFW